MSDLKFFPRFCNSIIKRYFGCNVIPKSYFETAKDSNNYLLLKDWAKVDFAALSPHFVKQKCLFRNGLQGSSWVETGTYLGDTTFLLSDIVSHVYSIEPEKELAKNATKRFKDIPNIDIINSTREACLPTLLPNITGDISFWLDGHYSRDITYEGDSHTPILQELKAIEENLKNFEKVAIIIDDIRCFLEGYPGCQTYPSLNIF